MSGPIVITGMHRSGTSLLASLLRSSGLHLGERLLPPSRANQPGYFEDVDFIELHDRALKRMGRSMYDPPDSTGAFDGDVLEGAQSLLEKSTGQSPWGWKDPRSALFLEQWLRLAPDAQFVFVYRHPTQVIHSLRRRGDAELQWQYPGAASVASLGGFRFRIAKAASMWIQYNRRIVEFTRKHPEQSTILPLDNLSALVPPVLAHFRSLGYPLQADVDVKSIEQTELMVKSTPWWINWYCEQSFAMQHLLQELHELAAASPMIHGEGSRDE